MTTTVLRALPKHSVARCRDVALGGSAQRRLAELGLRPAATLQVLSRTSGGGLIVEVGGARVAIDAEVAHVITVDDSGVDDPGVHDPGVLEAGRLRLPSSDAAAVPALAPARLSA